MTQAQGALPDSAPAAALLLPLAAQQWCCRERRGDDNRSGQQQPEAKTVKLDRNWEWQQIMHQGRDS
jgi:hypothetical protein